MQFTGTDLTLKRTFYTQSGVYGFAANITVDNTTGLYRFGLTGAGQVLEFTLNSGRLSYGSQFIHTYRSYQAFAIEAQFTSGAANIIKDGVPLAYGLPKTTGNYHTFYFTRANAGMSAAFDVEISGNSTPSFTVSQQGYLLTSGQGGVTGYFVNQSAFPLRVFDSSIQATQNYQFGKLAALIGAPGTGTFAYSGDFDALDLSQPILTTFNTSYQDSTVLFNIVDARTMSKFIYLTGPTDFSFNTAGILNREVTYLNYSGGFVTDAFNSALTFELRYLSGSGYFPGPESPYEVNVFGNFIESGLLTGIVQTPTGNINVYDFGWATGTAMPGYFSGHGTGYATGIGWTGLATGLFTGMGTGFIFEGSGTLQIGRVTGRGFQTVMYKTTYATGYIDFADWGTDDSTHFVINNDPESATIAWSSFSGDGIPEGCSGSYYVMNSLAGLTGLIACLSGFGKLANGVYDGGTIIRFTALEGGEIGNSIYLYDDWGGAGAGALIGGVTLAPTPGVLVYPVGPYTGNVSLTLTGSGGYQNTANGTYFPPYAKTFTGSWGFLTGLSNNTLVSVEPSGQVSDGAIYGSGLFLPNDQMTFQVTHNYINSGSDSAYLIISGVNVLNPIVQVLNY